MVDLLEQKLENAFKFKQKTSEQGTKLQDEWFNIYLWFLDSIAKFAIWLNGITLTIFLTLKEKFVWVVCLWWFLPLWILLFVSALFAILMKYFYAKMRFSQAKYITCKWDLEICDAKLSLPKDLTTDWNGEQWRTEDFELIQENKMKYENVLLFLSSKEKHYEKICTWLLFISVASFFIWLGILIYIGYRLTF